MTPRELSLHVVGARFDNPKGKGNRQFEIMVCEPGEPIELRPEPKNKADPNAIAVYSCRGIQIGYLTAERAPWVGGFMRQGEPIAAIFQQPTEFGAAIRVAIGGGEPVLPAPDEQSARSRSAPPEGGDADSEFYPDFIPPDD